MTTPIRVVIADDHALVREGTSQLLSNHANIEVAGTAANGVDALDLIARELPDVALVDIAMPGLTGIEVTREISANHPSVAVLILTVHDEEAYVRALIEAGAAGYLLKDIGEADLVRSIRAVHAGESVLHPDVTETLFRSLISGTAGVETGRTDSPLTDRELEVLLLAAKGQSNREIATNLSVSPRTVQSHLGNMFEKLNVASRTQAVITGLRNGWLNLEELS